MTKLPHPPSESSFSALIERFWTALAQSSETERELRSKRTIVRRHLEPAFARLRVDELHASEIDAYKTRKLEQGLSAKTINNHLSVLRGMLRFAKAAGLIVRVPVVHNLELAPNVPDFLNPDQVKRLLDAAEGEHHAMILLALRAGLRLGELRALQWEDLDFTAPCLRVRAEGSRSNALGRELPLSPATAAVLQALPRRSPFVFSNADGSRLSHGACKWPLYRAARRAGLEPIGWQVLRNTFTRELLTRNVSVRAVQNLLGCRSSAPVLRYVPAAEDSERAAILLLDVRDPIGSRRATRWHRDRAAAERELPLFILVTNDRRQRPRFRDPHLGGPRVPVLPRVTRIEPAN